MKLFSFLIAIASGTLLLYSLDILNARDAFIQAWYMSISAIGWELIRRG